MGKCVFRRHKYTVKTGYYGINLFYMQLSVYLRLFNQNKTTSDRQRYGSAGLFQIGGFFSLCSIYLHYQTTKIHMCWCVVAGHFHCKKIYSGRLKQGFSQLLLTANSYFDPCKIKSTFLNCKKCHNAQCSDHFHHHVASFSH